MAHVASLARFIHSLGESKLTFPIQKGLAVFSHKLLFTSTSVYS
jgi:hypothetical protein